MTEDPGARQQQQAAQLLDTKKDFFDDVLESGGLRRARSALTSARRLRSAGD